MKVARTIVAVITAIALAVTFVAAGFAVCLQQPVTQGLSSAFAKDDVSPFSRAQLVQVADATREFSFGNHDVFTLYRAIYAVDEEYSQAIVNAGGTMPSDFPRLSLASATPTLPQMKSVFAGASELYCFSEETIAHLDDCHAIASRAVPILIIAAAFALVGMVFTGVVGKKRLLGVVLLAAGIVVLVAFAALGIWAAVDFNGFFTLFHQLFFSQGNWTFPYDSLLICALPTEFWMGMGAIWLVVAVLLSALSIIVGRRLSR